MLPSAVPLIPTQSQTGLDAFYAQSQSQCCRQMLQMLQNLWLRSSLALLNLVAHALVKKCARKKDSLVAVYRQAIETVVGHANLSLLVTHEGNQKQELSCREVKLNMLCCVNPLQCGFISVKISLYLVQVHLFFSGLN